MLQQVAMQPSEQVDTGRAHLRLVCVAGVGQGCQLDLSCRRVQTQGHWVLLTEAPTGG